MKRATIITDIPDHNGKPINSNMPADRLTIHGEMILVYRNIDGDIDELVAAYRESDVRAAYITESNGAKQ